MKVLRALIDLASEALKEKHQFNYRARRFLIMTEVCVLFFPGRDWSFFTDHVS